MWSPILYGCFRSRGRSYDYDVIGAEHHAVASLINSVRISAGTWLSGGTKANVFFGRHGLVGDYLDWSHKAAHDAAGRRLVFFLGYVASCGTRLPSTAELPKLQEQVKSDLTRLVDVLWDEQRIFGDTDAVNLPRFQQVSQTTSLWDRTVDEIDAGRRDVLVTINIHGEHTVHAVEADSTGPLNPREDRGQVLNGLDLAALKKKEGHRRKGLKSLFFWNRRTPPN